MVRNAFDFESGYKAGYTKGFKEGAYDTFCYGVESLSVDMKQKLYDFLCQLAADQENENEEVETR